MKIADWMERLYWAVRQTEVHKHGSPMSLDDLSRRFAAECKYHIDNQRGRILLIGNGGSLAIASHLATDFALAGWPSIALTDTVALTSHTNDFGAESNFVKQLELLRITPNDILVAMSCSGRSLNILSAVRHARDAGCDVFTLSGFEPDNALRAAGDYNIYVPSHSYGIVQLAHEAILHAICDEKSGANDGS